MRPTTRATGLLALAASLGIAGTAFSLPVFRAPPAPRPPVIQPPPPVIRPGPVMPGRPGIGGPHFPGPGGGPVWLPPPPPRIHPGVVRGDLARTIQVRPADAFMLLAGERASVLPHAERTALAKQAVRQLRINVEKGGNPWNNLAELRNARASASRFTPEVSPELDAVRLAAERRLLAEVLGEAHARAQGGAWGEAVAWANEAIPRLQDGLFPDSSKEFTARRAEARDALHQLATVGRLVAALDRLEVAARGQEARALREVPLDALPTQLQAPTRALRGLAEVREVAAGRWDRAPNVAALKENVALFERGLADVPGADTSLGKQILQDLAVKAFLEGHPAEYKALMPADGPAQHAADLLRDMKALALGEGKVATWPAESALPAAKAGKGPASPRGPPPGLKPLIPEGPARGWRPPVRDNAKRELPPLEKAVKLSGALKARIETGAKSERAKVEKQATAARARIDAVRQRVLLPELAERRRFSEIEAALERRLTVEERVRARELVEQKKANQEIVAAFQAQPAADDDETFLRELAARLKRNLRAGEREQALRLRKAGRKVVEVADILGP